jgi:hypothetical protein
MSAESSLGAYLSRRRKRSGLSVETVSAGSWIVPRVTADGGPPTEETLSPGTVREWRSARVFRVTLGNADGVELALDGRALHAVGERGQVVHATIPDEPRP